MDIYNEDDNVISSDEYDDGDDLLNVAITSASLKNVETQKTSFNPAVSQHTKPQRKQISAIGMKIRRKSVKWLQQKFKRNQIRNRYLYSIARAKNLHKTECVSTMGGTANQVNESAIEELNKVHMEQSMKEILAEKKIQMVVDKKLIEHETIDLDDSDEDDDMDDYDEDDDSSTDSSNDEINNDEHEDKNGINDEEEGDLNKIHNLEDLHEINDDDDNDLNESNYNDNHDLDNLKNNLQNNINTDFNDKCNTISKTIDDIKIEADPMSVVVASENENIPELTSTAPVFNMSISHVANSTMQEQNPQKDVEAMVIAPSEPNYSAIAPTEPNQKTDTSSRTHAGTESNKNKLYLTSNTTANNGNSEISNLSKNLGIEQSFFFNDELNAMYPNFDKIVNDHVTFPETAEIIRERIKIITADVEHINQALEIKEKECNQLLYVKHTKEQILARLLRKIKRNEVNTDEQAIEAFALRELGITPKQTHTKEPPTKKRKLEPRTALEIIEHGASMSMDEVLRAKAQNKLDENFIEETLKKFGLNTPKPNKKIRESLNKIQQKIGDFSDTSLNLSMPDKRSNQSTLHLPKFESPINHQHASSTMRGQNLLLNLLNAENDSDDASISYNIKDDLMKGGPTLRNLFENWAAHQQQQLQQQQRMQNFNNREENAFEVILENEAPTKTPKNFFPLLNQNKRTLPNSDETVIVHLDVTDFKDNASTQKSNGNISSYNFICQYCGIHKAQYVCAECENQWYCSRSCQVKAWDSHSETCE